MSDYTVDPRWGKEKTGTAADGQYEPPATSRLRTSSVEVDEVVSEALEVNLPLASKHSPPSRDEESFFAAFCKWIVEHQIGRPHFANKLCKSIDLGIGISVNLLLLLSLTHISFPKARRYTRKFSDLSYYNASTRKYGAGWDDAYLILFWIVVFTGVRVAAMEYLLQPLAEAGGIRKRKMKVRFAEQAWIFVYYTLTCSLGLVGTFYSSPNLS